MNIKTVYDPKLFRDVGKIATEALTRYLENASFGKDVRTWNEPDALLKKAEALLASPPIDVGDTGAAVQKLRELVELYLSTNHALHSGHYMGHQVPPPIPLAGIFDFIGSTTNQAPGLYEMGPLPTVAEKAVMNRMAQMIGWDPELAGMIGTSGGSVANLTAILAARNHRYKDSWNEGVASNSSAGRPAIVVGADAHYSIARAAGILGLGSKQVLMAPIDSEHRMDAQALKPFLEQAKKDGHDVFCIVGSSCSTPTGAFDPLEVIASVAKEFGIWFHVDGAHGASVLFSKKHRSLLNGIEHADSISWDAHKMLFMPALSTFLFYKKKHSSYIAFQQDAPYLYDPKNLQHMEFDCISRTLECTKRPLAMGLWAIWSTFGETLFEDLIDYTFGLAQDFYKLLSELPDFEPLHTPQANILCFRYLPDSIKNTSPKEVADFQRNIRDQLIRRGHFYVTGTNFKGLYCLRVTLINPQTTRDHLIELTQELRAIAEGS